jgi:phosphatidylglycerol:prolipoprotein diacylglycerol transferase
VHYSRRQGLDPDKSWNLGILAILAGIGGAKLLLIINDWQFFSAHPREVFTLATLQAGGVWAGGLAAALLVSWVYIRLNHIPVLTLCDTFAPGVALGHAIGRLGCFAAGCCWGKPTDLPWGVTFSSPVMTQLGIGTPLGIPLHPTQLYEMALELANFFLLAWMLPRKKFEGQVLGTYLFVYGLARYFLEYLRDDPERGNILHGLMTGTQALAVGSVIVGGLLWMNRHNVPHTEIAPLGQAASK